MRISGNFLYLFVFSSLLVCFDSHMAKAAGRQKIVILDSGHDPVVNGDSKSAGAVGTCGQFEVEYNDAATTEIDKSISADRAYSTILTRQPGKSVEISDSLKPDLHKYLSPAALARLEKSPNLIGRSAIANAAHCDALISVHHDSTLDEAQEGEPNCQKDPKTQKIQPGIRLKDDFKKKYKVGYSVLIYEDDKNDPKRVKDSKKLAAHIAFRIKSQLNRTPSDYHGKDGDCLNSNGTPDCRDINPELGIIHKDVAVLRETRCPAVLVEVGNIADGGPGGDERKINNPAFRAGLAKAIKKGLDDYFNSKRRSEPARPETDHKQN